jgi:hypothetical protein
VVLEKWFLHMHDPALTAPASAASLEGSVATIDT